MKRLLALLITCLLVVVAAFTATPLALEQLLLRQLANHGYSLEQFELGHPDSQHWQLHKLTASGSDIRLQLEDLSARYQLRELFSQPRLENLNIGVLSVDIKQSESDTAAQPLDLSQLLPSHWLANPPLGQLTIESLNIKLTAADGRVLQLLGKLHFSRDSIELQLSEPRYQLTLQAKLQADNRLTLTLIEQQSPLAKLAIKLLPSDKQLKLQGDVNVDFAILERLRPWLTQLPLAQSLSGQFQSSIELTLPGEWQDSKQLIAQSHGIFYPRLSLQAGAFKIQGLTLSGAELSAQGLCSSQAEVVSCRLSSASQLQLQQLELSEQQITLPSLKLELLEPLTLSSQQLASQQLEKLGLRFTLAPWHWRELTFNHPALLVNAEQLDAGRLTGQVEATLEKLTISGASLATKQVTLSRLATKASSDGQKLAVKIAPGLAVEAKQVQLPSLAIEHLGAALVAPLTLWPLEQRAGALDLQLSSSELRLAESRLQLDPMQLKLAPFSWQDLNLKGKIQIPRWQLEHPLARLNGRRFNASLHGLKKPRISFSSQIDSLSNHLSGRLTANSNFNRGQLTWQLSQVELTTLAQTFGAIVPLPKELQLQAGQYSNSGTANWQGDKLSAQLDHQLSSARLNYDEAYQLQGLDISAQSHWQNGILEQQLQLSLAKLEGPVLLSDTQLNASLQARDSSINIDLHSARAQALEGQLSLSPFSGSLKPLNLATTLDWRAIALDKLLALQPSADIAGSGRLDASLPLQLDERGPSISQGKIAARAPGGWIRYRASPDIQAYAQQTPGLDIALKALENFHYDTLQIDASLARDGQMLLANRLQGRNPNWQAGHPVNLNLNIEENLYQLLKSLSFAQGLPPSIIQQNSP